MKILYQGSPGAYSHLAAKELYPDAEIISLSKGGESLSDMAKIISTFEFLTKY